jgi:hypothetical protein
MIEQRIANDKLMLRMTKTERLDDVAVAKALEEIRDDLPKSVIRLRHKIENDWSGDPAVYVFVTVRDGFADEPNFARESKKIRDRIWDAIRGADIERLVYPRFATVSEERRTNAPQRARRQDVSPVKSNRSS